MNNLQLYLGPPGTGKTTTLLNRVEEIIDSGVHPRDIAFVSFTRKAAYEARDRALAKFPDLTAKDLPYWATLHSVCFRRLHLGRSDVMQRANWHEIAKMTNCEMSGHYNIDDGQLAGGVKEGDKFLFYYGLAHAMKVPWNQVLKNLPRHERMQVDHAKFGYFCSTLTKYKYETGLLDFNDMLEQATDTGPLDSVSVAIIDEAQDLSLRQWDVVQSLFPHCNQVIIAGDDDQAIYEWSGADLPSFLNLKGVTTVLDRSYRLPQVIFDYADQIVSRIKRRFMKSWSPDQRAGSVRTIAMLDPLKERLTRNDGESWLFLFRNAYFMTREDGGPSFVDQLKSWGVPTAIKDKTLYKHDDLRAIHAFELLRSGKAVSSSDVALLYGKYLRGNSVQIKRGCKQLPQDTPDIVTWEWLVENAGLVADRSSKWFELQMFGKQMNPTLNTISIKDVNYYRQLRRNGFKTTDGPKIVLSTIHGVKGGEADNVIVYDGMSGRTARGMIENPDAEHRVWYVAVTRARENLFVFKSSGEDFYPL